MPGEPQAGVRPEIPRAIALSVAALGAAITFAIAFGVKSSVERRIVERFNEVAVARAERLGFEFGRYQDDLLSLAGHLDAAESIDKATFERLARRGVALPGVRALMWFDPSVLDRASAATSESTQRDSKLATRAVASASVPRYLAQFSASAEPVAAEKSVGSAQRSLFERAQRNGKLQLSAPLHTNKFPYEAPLYQVVIPVPVNRAPASEAAPLLGFVVGVYRAQPIVDAVMSNKSNALAVRVTDRGVPLGHNLLAIHAQPADTPLLGQTIHRAQMRLGDRVWELEFTPTDAFIAENRTDEPMLVLALGLALSAAASIAALASARWRRDLLALVAQRTAELAASEARQRAVVANMADALVVTDSAGMIESVNGAAQRLFGWEAPELAGRELSLLVPKIRELNAGAERADAGAQPDPSECELHGLRRDGSEFPLGMALSLVREQGSMRRIALMRDLSRERRAERAMSTFIAATSKATGVALLHAATRSLAQALGMRCALIAESTEKAGQLRIVSLWSDTGHDEVQRCYDIAGEPCAGVLGQQLRCHTSGLRRKYPQSRLSVEFEAQSYIGHPLQAADGKTLGIVALYGGDDMEQTTLAVSLLSMAASRIAAEIERLESDQALLSSRERLELAVEGSQLALWDLNVATGEVFLSERWSAIVGAAAGTTQTSLASLFGRVHSEDHAGVNLAYRDALRGTVPFYEVTHRVKRNDGAWVWVRSHGKVSQRDASGRALRLVGTNADVTWERTAAEEVARRERELRAISDNVPATIVRLDRDLRYLYANRRYAAMFGADVNSLLGRRLIDVLGERSYQDVEPHLKRSLDGAMVTYDRELAIGGRRRRLEVTVIPDVNAEWDVQGVFCIGLDVTERKEIERRMVEARTNAEAAARAKSEFLATMSHEIRTPMNGVLGLADLLLDTELSAEQHGYVDTLHRCANSLLEILNDILDMSKIEAGKLSLEPIPFDLAATVEDVAALWAPRASAKSLEVVVQIEPSCARRLIGDPGRIRQVLGNLVGNAVKFTETGHVLLRVSAAGECCEDAQVLFEVEDSGVGIAPSDCRRLFEPFAQADASTTRRFGGTGLGLAICRRLVQLMDGQIGVESTPGKGSRFWFSARLPAGAEQPPLQGADLDGKRVLIVEDHPVTRTALRKQLQAFGMQVTCAAHADEVWQLLQAAAPDAPFDVALMDHDRPDADAIGLSLRLQHDARWKTLPMVLLTSGGHKVDRARAHAAGFCGFLIKPARAHMLRTMLVAAVAGQPGAEMIVHPRAELSRQRFQGKVLLVEDNEVNRRVALAILRKLGLEVDAAVNGAQAIERSGERHYDIVLMDMHMPIMDGLEATRAIRARESAGTQRLPIVAMTANVVTEARAACFDAGMDDFLPKPFVREQLVRSLGRWLPAATEEPSAGRQGALDAPPIALLPLPRELEVTLDYARLDDLRAAIGEDFGELIAVFLGSATEGVRALRDACERGDAQALHRHAHSLKSSAANVGAMMLSRLARRLESDAQAGPVADMRARSEAIALELERIAPMLQEAAAMLQGSARAVG